MDENAGEIPTHESLFWEKRAPIPDKTLFPVEFNPNLLSNLGGFINKIQSFTANSEFYDPENPIDILQRRLNIAAMQKYPGVVSLSDYNISLLVDRFREFIVGKGLSTEDVDEGFRQIQILKNGLASTKNMPGNSIDKFGVEGNSIFRRWGEARAKRGG